MRKNLIIISSYLPNTKKEVFYYNEFVKIAPSFKNVSLVYHFDLPNTDAINEKYHSYKVKYLPSKVDVIFGLRFLFNPVVLNEIYFLFKKRAFSFKIFKALLGAFVSAKRIEHRLASIIRKSNFKEKETTLFTYWNNNTAAALALIKNRCPELNCVSRAHGYDVYEERSEYNYLPFRPFIFTKLDKVLFISEDGKKYSIRNFGNYSSFEVIRIGVAIAEFRKQKIDIDRVLIVSCSNLVKVKRVDRIIKLVSKIKNKKVLWVHFGSGPLKDQLKRLAIDKLQRITDIEYSFKGETANVDILNYYAINQVDCFINLSESEGIPVSIMEAMAYGIPVIATDVGGVAEIVIDKMNGFLINDFDLDEFDIATTINDIKNNSSSLSSNAHKSVLINYNEEKTISSLIKSLKFG